MINHLATTTDRFNKPAYNINIQQLPGPMCAGIKDNAFTLSDDGFFLYNDLPVVPAQDTLC